MKIFSFSIFMEHFMENFKLLEKLSHISSMNALGKLDINCVVLNSLSQKPEDIYYPARVTKSLQRCEAAFCDERREIKDLSKVLFENIGEHETKN